MVTPLSSSEPREGGSARGRITAIGGSSLADAETFTLSDGVNPTVISEFDKTGSVSSGRVQIPISNTVIATDVATARLRCQPRPRHRRHVHDSLSASRSLASPP